MTVISTLPVQYNLHGIPAGKRKPVDCVVQEVVAVEIPEVDPEIRLDVGETRCVVAGRRFWVPAGVGAIGRHPVSGPQALSNWAERETSNWVGDLSGVAPVDLVRDDPAKLHQVTVRPRDAWSAHFRSVEWCDRDRAVERAARSASRLAFVEGVLHTDRLEPVVNLGIGWKATTLKYVVNVDNHERFGGYGGIHDLRHEKHVWLALPPSEGPLAGEVDWQTEVSVGCAAYLADVLQDQLSVSGTVTERDRFLAAMPYTVLSAVNEVVLVRECLVKGVPFQFGREDLARVIDRLEGISSIRDPRRTWAADSVSKALDRVHEVVTAYDEVVAPSAVPVEDLSVLSGPGLR